MTTNTIKQVLELLESDKHIVYRVDEAIRLLRQAPDSLERFAKLVAAKEQEAIIDLVAFYGGPVDLEAAIRARGEA